MSHKSITYRVRPVLNLLLMAVLAVWLSGCLTARSQRTGYLLTRQTFKGNHTLTDDELENLLPQKPNSRLLGLPISPKLWFYEQGSKHYDRQEAIRQLQAKTNEFDQQSQQLAGQPNELKKLNRTYARTLKKLRVRAEEGNWLMRSLGQPPSYFAERDAHANSIKLQKYLTEKGFFNAAATYRLDTLAGHQIRVTYLIAEHEPFVLRRIAVRADDPQVDTLVQQSLDKSLLKTGERFDMNNITNEKIRIENLLRNQGYYAFSRQYVQFGAIDTTQYSASAAARPADVSLHIINPPGLAAHAIYHIGDVTMRVSSENSPLSETLSDSVVRNGITYRLGGFSYPTKLLDSKILLRPGDLYRQDKYRDTQRQLFLLNQFKFVNTNFIDTSRQTLRTLILASPLDKYEATVEGGVTGLLYQAQGYPGGFGSLIFRARNLFHGLETFELSARYGIEAQTGFVTNTGSDRPYSAQELGLSMAITFPQILFPGAMRRGFVKANPRTQISLSFNNTFRPDFQRSLLRSTMGYYWQPTPLKQYNVLIADINLINANHINPLFQERLDSLAKLGNTLYQSFRRSLSSSISFAYTYNNNIANELMRTNRHPAHFLRTVAESGGTTLNLFSNQTIERWSQPNVTGLQYYKFLRLNVDYRHYLPIRSRSMLAMRFNAGLVWGYGPNKTAPYEKLFFAGGSNSVRAWLPRRLGPGSSFPYGTNSFYPDTNRNGQFIYLFEQPGDLLLETSAELRFPLFHLGFDMAGAVFVDAGNVWLLSQRGARPSSTFNLNSFFPQIAVGTGVGLRMDFSFFVIRFDGGIKVWDPAHRYYNTEGQLIDDRFLLPRFSFRQLTRGVNPLIINFGIGYPF